MRQTDPNIQKQLDKPITWFFKYFPVRIKNVSFADLVARKLVYDFKDGDELSVKMVAEETASQMKDKYGDKCSDIVFSCVPASSAVKNEIRYKKFCSKVCELCGCINGYDHVKVVGERLSVHENRGKEKEIRKVNIVEFDKEWFKGREVICFDDIITKGHSYANYANQLESLGASVLGGMFLARTHYNVNI